MSGFFGKSAASVVLLLLGAFVGVYREAIVAKFFGSSYSVDSYRIAMGLPLAFSQGFALGYINRLIGFSKNKYINSVVDLRFGVSRDSFIVFCVGVVTIPAQIEYLGPGLEGTAEDYVIFVSSWLMYVLVAQTFWLRVDLGLSGKGWVVPLFQLARNMMFVVSVVFVVNYARAFSDTILLAVSVVLSALFLPLVGRYYLKFNKDKAIIQPDFSGLGLKALGVLIASHIMFVSGRIIDRSLASNLGEGSVSNIEYSYVLIMAIVGLISTPVILIIIPVLKSEFRLFCFKNSLGLSILLVVGLLAAYVLSTSADYLILFVYGSGLSGSDVDSVSEVFSIQIYGVVFAVMALVLIQYVYTFASGNTIVMLMFFKAAIRLFCILAFRGELGLADIAKLFVIVEISFFILTYGYVIYSDRNRNYLGKSR